MTGAGGSSGRIDGYCQALAKAKSKAFGVALGKALTRCNQEDFVRLFPTLNWQQLESLYKSYCHVLQRIGAFCQEEFEDICATTKIDEYLQELEREGAARGLIFDGQVFVPFRPSGGDNVSPEAMAQQERIAVKKAERRTLEDAMGEAQRLREQLESELAERQSEVEARAADLNALREQTQEVLAAPTRWMSRAPASSMGRMELVQ